MSPGATAVGAEYRRLRALLIAAYSAFSAGTVGAAGWYLHAEHRLVVETARSNAGTLARALEEHVLRTFTTIDAQLRNAGRRLVETRALERPTDSVTLELLREEAANVPLLRSIYVYDAAGRGHTTSLGADIRRLRAEDLAHLREIRDGNTDTLVVGRAIPGAVTRRPNIPVARAVLRKDGALAGFIGSAIEPAYFEGFYKALGLAPGSSIALIRTDGAVLVRFPEVPGAPADLSNSEFFQRTAREAAGTADVVSSFDGTRRIIAFRRVPGWNLIVSNTQERDAVLAPWRRVAWAVGSLALVSLAVFLGLLKRSLRELRRRAGAEAELARLAAIVESSSDAILSRGLDRKVMTWNNAAERMLGYAAAEVIGRDIDFLIPADARAEIADRRPVVDAGGTVPPYDTVRVAKDGRRIDVSVTTSPIKDAAGRMVGVSLMYRDISERKRADEAQGRLAAIVEHSEDAIVSRGLERRIATWNAAAERLFGYAAAEVIGRSIDFLIPADQQAQAVQMRALLAEGTHIPPYDAVRLTKDGRRIDVSLTQSPIRDARGNIVGVSLTFRDITERKRAEEAQGRLAAIVEDSGDAIISRDVENRVITWNAAAERLFGYSAREVIGRPIDFLVPPDQQAQVEQMRALLAAGEHVPPYETVRLAKDGRRVDVSLTLSPIRNASGLITGVSLTIRDITERRRLEQQLSQGQKMQALGQLTGGVAHDFNNLLGVILGNLDLLERELAHNEPALKRVATAQRAAARGADLTQRLLAFSRRQALKAEPVALDACVAGVIEMARRTIGPDIAIQTAIAPGLPAVRADAAGLENVLLNLVINSRDAMPQGGTIGVAARLAELDEHHPGVRAGELAAGRYMCVTLSDTGQGMTPQVLERAFEPFFTTKERGKGTGLGLAMVYGFVKQSGGHVSIYSEPGRGTTIKLYLPLAEAGVQAARAPQAESEHERIEATALVVDDEADLLEVAATYLEEMGFRVLRALDGPGALELLGREPAIELLLTDIMMPGGMNGVELARRAREARSGLRVLYSTGFSSVMLDQKVGAAVDSAVLSKPYRRAEFAAAVRKAMANGSRDSADGRRA